MAQLLPDCRLNYFWIGGSPNTGLPAQRMAEYSSWGFKSPDSFWSYYDSELMMMHIRMLTNEEALQFLEERHAFDQEGEE